MVKRSDLSELEAVLYKAPRTAFDEYLTLKAQRDELLEALEFNVSVATGLAVALDAAQHFMEDCSFRRGINEHLGACMEKIAEAEAAIAKARGQS